MATCLSGEFCFPSAADLRRSAWKVLLCSGLDLNKDAARRSYYRCGGASRRRRGGEDDVSGFRSGAGACSFDFHGGFPVFAASVCMRFVVVFLCAMGNDLLCSLVGSLFRVGVFGAGGGFLAGLLLLRGASASFIFGWPWGLLEVPKLLFISFRAPDLGSGPHRKWKEGVRLGSLKAIGVSFFVGICGDDGGGELGSAGMELDEMNRLSHLRKKGFVLILYSVGVFLQKGCTCPRICSFQ